MKPTLTPELQHALVEALERGDLTVSQAAEQAGLRPATLRVWLSRGAKAHTEIPQLLSMLALARAVAVGRERASRGVVGQRVAELVAAGFSFRAAAAGAGIDVEAARLLVRDAAPDSPLAALRHEDAGQSADAGGRA